MHALFGYVWVANANLVHVVVIAVRTIGMHAFQIIGHASAIKALHVMMVVQSTNVIGLEITKAV